MKRNRNIEEKYERGNKHRQNIQKNSKYFEKYCKQYTIVTVVNYAGKIIKGDTVLTKKEEKIKISK